MKIKSDTFILWFSFKMFELSYIQLNDDTRMIPKYEHTTFKKYLDILSQELLKFQNCKYRAHCRLKKQFLK